MQQKKIQNKIKIKQTIKIKHFDVIVCSRNTKSNFKSYNDASKCIKTNLIKKG